MEREGSEIRKRRKTTNNVLPLSSSLNGSFCPSSQDDSNSNCTRNANLPLLLQQQLPPILQLPEVLLYAILSFVAGPTHRAHVICHQLAPLSKTSAVYLLERTRVLWQAVLEGDYGARLYDHAAPKHNRQTRGATKRQRDVSPIFRVKDAHCLVKDNTELAYYDLEELTTAPSSSSSSSAKKSSSSSLTASRLQSIVQEYGPRLRINDRTKVGGTFLVACCKARHSRECHVRQCVELLVDQYGANVNVSSMESMQSSTLTPLCVAAARGMPTVVQCLLSRGASTTETGTGRFRLHTNARRSIKCSNATPLQFAQNMRHAEEHEGANKRDLKDLDKCIRLLKQTA